jgi:enamine deaminase RidA (YjgF/YER057c/UK114 family)
VANAKIVAGQAAPRGRYPHARLVGDILFISGISSRRPDNTHVGAEIGEDGLARLDIKAQTRAVIANIDSICREFGGSIADVVDVTTFLVNMNDFSGYNDVYGEVFQEDGPTRTTVAVHQLPHPHLLIEMKAIAKIS